MKKKIITLTLIAALSATASNSVCRPDSKRKRAA